MARAAGNTDETTDPTNGPDDDDEKGTAAEDAFEAELNETIGAALDDDDDEEKGADDAEDLLDVDVDDEEDEDEEEDTDPADASTAAAKDDPPRDAQGKFAPKDAVATEAKKPEGDAAAAGDEKKPDAAAAADATAAAKPAEPTWEPLEVKAGDETVKIDEAKISRFNGHLWAVVPEKQASRFLQRISRGAQYERVSRQLDRDRRELEARKTAPAQKSDSEIEAEITLEALKPFLGEILEPKDVQLLELRIENAKSKVKSEYAAAEQARLAKASETPWEEQQADLLDDVIAGMLKHPELAGLTADVVDEIKEKEFLPVRNALIFQENGQPVGNTQFIFERLKRARTAAAAAPAAASAAPADTTKPASSQTSAKADTSASTATKKPADQADRFNRGADAAAKPAAPSTTSVKAKRDARPAKGAPRAEKAAAGRTRSSRDERADAEDHVRKTDRKFMNSPGFDFDEDDEDDED